MAKKATDSAVTISVKVSEKGAVSIYGLGRFPTTLYREQLTAILDKKEALLDFMEKNKSKLKVKSEGGGPAGSTSL